MCKLMVGLGQPPISAFADGPRELIFGCQIRVRFLRCMAMVAGLEQGDPAFRAGRCLRGQTVRTGRRGRSCWRPVELWSLSKALRGVFGVHDMAEAWCSPARWVLLKRAF